MNKKGLKSIIIGLFSIVSINSFSQNESELRNAFKQSYLEETNLKYSKAIEVLTPFIASNSYEINIRMAWLNYSNAKFKEACEFYKKAIQLESKSVDAKFGYIYALAALEKWDLVIEQYKAILMIDPAHALANYNLALLYFNRNEFKNGVNFINNYVSYYPFNFDGLNLAGWFQYNLGNKELAIKYFKKALLVNPNTKSYDAILKESK